jgi:hypothetical protein
MQLRAGRYSSSPLGVGGIPNKSGVAFFASANDFSCPWLPHPGRHANELRVRVSAFHAAAA